MAEWKVKKSLLEDLCAAAQNYYPDEFMCFLGGEAKGKTITEIVFLPNTSGKNFASISEATIPIDDTIIGSFHSHPHGSPFPSKQDKKFFQRYKINAVLGFPFNLKNMNFFGGDGEKQAIKLIE